MKYDDDEDLMVTLFFIAFAIFIGFLVFVGIGITIWGLL